MARIPLRLRPILRVLPPALAACFVEAVTASKSRTAVPLFAAASFRLAASTASGSGWPISLKRIRQKERKESAKQKKLTLRVRPMSEPQNKKAAREYGRKRSATPNIRNGVNRKKRRHEWRCFSPFSYVSSCQKGLSSYERQKICKVVAGFLPLQQQNYLLTLKT